MCHTHCVFINEKMCWQRMTPEWLTDRKHFNPCKLVAWGTRRTVEIAELQETLIKGFWRVVPLSMSCPIDFKMIEEPGVYKLAHFTSNLSLQYRLLFSKCVIISMITEQQVHGLAFIVYTCTFNFVVLLQVYTCTSNNNVIKPLRLKTPYTNQ